MASPLVRRVHNATNPLHSMVYFAPEAEAELTGAGLEPGRMCYFASRAAPMGPVSAGVVTATFYNFNPALVGGSIPRAWTLADPERIISARFEAAGQALARLLGPELTASAELTTLTGLVREAAGACTPEGRALYAGHADLDWPAEPVQQLWHGLTLLREYRGDGHVAALTISGLSGLEALITHTVTGKGFTPQFARASRGWSQAEWDAAIAGLAARGLLRPDGTLTAAGHEVRARAERETDQLAAGPWQHLGDERTEEVVRIGRLFSAAALDAGAFPDGVLMASDPRTPAAR
jgi:hypothetical protein